MKVFLVAFCLLALFGILWGLRYFSSDLHARQRIHCIEKIEDLFPQTPEAAHKLVATTKKGVLKRLEKIYTYKPEDRTFANTMGSYDRAVEQVHIASAALEVLALASPDEKLRTAGRQGFTELGSFIIEELTLNPRLYKACLEYESLMQGAHSKEHLNDVERYFVEQTMKSFRREGLERSLETQEKIKALKKEINELSVIFDQNLSDDKRSIEVSLDGLKGLDDIFIQSLEKTVSGNYRLGVDNPTYEKVLDECEVEETRKLLYKQYIQRGYPANEEVLIRLRALRDQLAQLLGYESYAHYDIDDQMAKNPATVSLFLAEVEGRLQEKVDKEVELLKNHLPQGVRLAPEGTFYPWDIRYIGTYYKKKFIHIDEQKVSEYFPFDHTLKALLEVYERFFGVSFKKVLCAGLWHPDVQCLAVYKDGCYYGTVILDLFPRDNKFTHAAQLTIVPSVKTPQEGLFPSVVFVIANFPRGRGEQPALFTRKNLTTFFHEFGHALHSLLGGTELASLSGTNVKGDFVEMPSQMLEEWIADPEILKMISKHYKTGESLPEDLIERIQASKNLFSGMFIASLLFGTHISLDYFLPSSDKELAPLWKKRYKEFFPYLFFDEDNRGYCSFIHLTAYGAKYYGYLWSKVYALDLFYTIKPHGLLNRTIGERYTTQIIGKGGSEDPALLLHTFLGRAPRSDAFFTDLGLKPLEKKS